MQNQIGKFRPKKNSFTITSNSVLLDTELDMATKTLHTLINYYLNIPNFTLYKAHIQRCTGLGDKSFNRMWKSLKDKGYLLQHKLKDEKGIFYYEYELLDQPHLPEAPVDSSPSVTAPSAEPVAITNLLPNHTLDSQTLNTEQQQPVLPPSRLDEEIQSTYLRAFGQSPNAIVEERLLSYLARFEKDVVLLALEMAGSKQKGIDYAYGILRVWGYEGAYTFDQVVAYEEGYC
ncbi:MAG: DnaD domain protein [Cellulosilyticaceae bacterium]